MHVVATHFAQMTWTGGGGGGVEAGSSRTVVASHLGSPHRLVEVDGVGVDGVGVAFDSHAQLVLESFALRSFGTGLWLVPVPCRGRRESRTTWPH